MNQTPQLKTPILDARKHQYTIMSKIAGLIVADMSESMDILLVQYIDVLSAELNRYLTMDSTEEFISNNEIVMWILDHLKRVGSNDVVNEIKLLLTEFEKYKNFTGGQFVDRFF